MPADRNDHLSIGLDMRHRPAQFCQPVKEEISFIQQVVGLFIDGKDA